MSSWKDYLKSSVITFITAFAIAILPMLGDASWESGAFVGILMAGARAGIKALFEFLALLKV